MTRILEEAVTRAKQLSEPEQDAIGQLVLNEIESDRRWEELFAKSPEKLRMVADQAWAEHEVGQSEPLDPDRL